MSTSAGDGQAYIVSLHRTCNEDDLRNLVADLKSKTDDAERPEFSVEIGNVMKSGIIFIDALLCRLT